MSDPTDRPKSGESHEHFWQYAVLSCILLPIFVVGILAPDYFNYRLRTAKIEALSKLTAASAPPVSLTSEISPPRGAANPVSSTPAAGKVPTDLLTSDALEIKTSEIFETYGKLLTMLLAFASVVGVFFGYFVRKSLREIEVDLRGNVTQNMDFWGKEKDRLSAEVNTKLKEITEHQKRLEQLTQDFVKRETESKSLLEALKAANPTEGSRPVSATKSTADAIAEINRDKTIPDREGA